MRIGSLKLENNLILAPMQNVTTAPYRRFCRKFNTIGLVYVPMIYTKRLEKNPASILKDLYKIEEERPLSIQLLGSEVNALKKSIDFLSSYNFDILDINAGCPSKRAIKAKEGGYLLKDLERLKILLNTAIKFSPKPVSLKIRTGYRTKEEILQITQIINKSNIDLVSIHGRTVKACFDDSKFDLESIKFLKENIGIPVIGNGDINSPVKAKEFIDYTQVDGLMIGRASMGNPKIFSQINSFLKSGEFTYKENQVEKMREYIREYEKIIDAIDYNACQSIISSDEIKFIELKRNAIWLTRFIENSKNMRIELSKSKSLKDLRLTLERLTSN